MQLILFIFQSYVKTYWYYNVKGVALLLSDNIKYELLQKLDGMENQTKVCHGNYNPSNVIVKDER